MSAIDSLAKAINAFTGGLVLVSHDFRLISQVAKEIWVCDRKSVQPWKVRLHRKAQFAPAFDAWRWRCGRPHPLGCPPPPMQCRETSLHTRITYVSRWACDRVRGPLPPDLVTVVARTSENSAR